MSLNFLFTSISFLPLYIPIVVEAQKRHIKCNFYIGDKQSKKYISPFQFSNKQHWEYYVNKYNIKIYPVEDISKTSGIVFVVDGDIYGANRENIYDSYLRLLNRNHIKISLIENFNYYFIYNKYINLVDHIIFPSKYYAEYYGFQSLKHLYLGNPKYDIIVSKDKVYDKYKLPRANKYVLIYYPKMSRTTDIDPIFIKFFKNIVSWIHSMGFMTMIKTRNKSDDSYYSIGFDYYFNDVQYHPITSIELLSICSLAIFNDSSVIEEVVASKVPFIEIKLDNIQRFSFLRHSSYTYLITKPYPNEKKFKYRVDRLLNNFDNYRFDDINKKYLNISDETSSGKILDYIVSKYKSLFVQKKYKPSSTKIDIIKQLGKNVKTTLNSNFVRMDHIDHIDSHVSLSSLNSNKTSNQPDIIKNKYNRQSDDIRTILNMTNKYVVDRQVSNKHKTRFIPTKWGFIKKSTGKYI